MFVAGEFIRALVCGACVVAVTPLQPATAVGPEPAAGSGESRLADGLFFGRNRRQGQEVINSLPLDRLTSDAKQRILDIADNPTLYRRLPVQAIECDREMFLFLARKPEVLVGMWQLMGITKVQTKRTGPYHLEAEDGSGTRCDIDLVYGDAETHIFVANGGYSGRLVMSPILGRGLFVLRSSYAKSSSGGTTVTGVLDCFIALDSIGADLVARPFSGIIGRSADHNFTETAGFMAQVSQMSARNPPAMKHLARRLPEVDPTTKDQFVATIAATARRADTKSNTATR